MMFGVFIIIKNSDMNNDDDYISITNTFSIHAIITFIIITFISLSPLLSSLLSPSLMLIKMETRIKKIKITATTTIIKTPKES